MTAGDSLRDRRFFFVHLQKTAGTTLYRRLRTQFGAQAVYPTPEYQGDIDAVIGVDQLVERFEKHRDEIRVVTGHFPLCTEDLLDADLVSFTLLREPVARTLSFLRHQREVAPEFRDAPLEEIYEQPLMRDGLVRNHMVRMLSMKVEEMTDGMLTQVAVDDGRVERAKSRLVERIDAFGVQEHFGAFCDLLERRYAWTLGPMHVANRTEPVAVPEALKRQIAADNGPDVELYRFAADEWARRSRGGETR